MHERERALLALLEADRMTDVFVLPFPVSNNDMYTLNKQGGLSMTSDARRWKKQARAALISQGAQSYPMIEKGREAAVLMRVHRDIGKTLRLDVANAEKLCNDVLQGLIFENDRQIKAFAMLEGSSMEDGALTVTAIAVDEFAPGRNNKQELFGSIG